MSKKNILDPRPAPAPASSQEATADGGAISSPTGAEAPQAAAVGAAVPVAAATPPEAAPIAEGAKTGDAAEPLAPLTKLPEDWREFSAAGLAELCRRAGLPVTGPRPHLIKRLEVKFFGSSLRHINGRVKCRYCGSPAKTTATRRMSDTVVERYYTCQGKRGHTFKIQEVVEAEPQTADAAGGDPSSANMRRFLRKEPLL